MWFTTEWSLGIFISSTTRIMGKTIQDNNSIGTQITLSNDNVSEIFQKHFKNVLMTNILLLKRLQNCSKT